MLSAAAINSVEIEAVAGNGVAGRAVVRAGHPKVAIFLPSLAGGGAERVALNLAEGLSGRGYRVDLVLAKEEGPLLGEVPPRVRLVNLKASRTIASLPRLAGYLWRERPMALLSGLDHANPIALAASFLSGTRTRVLLSAHYPLCRSIDAGSRSSKRLAMIARRCYYRAAGLVAVSQGVADDANRILGSRAPRIRVIYNPVITPRLFEKAAGRVDHPFFADPSTPVVVAAGRLAAEKDFATLLRGFARARELTPRAPRLVILGEGEARQVLEKLVADLGLAGNVSLPGFAVNPYPMIARASLVVLSSIWEALPTIVVESLALGTRVVATDCGGAREILGNGQPGTLCPIGDSEALGRAIAAAMDDPSPPAGLRGGNEESLSRFLMATAVDSYEQLILGAP